MAFISPASRSRIRVSQVVETNRGETPSSASYKVLPHLDNTSLNQTQTFERSAQVKSNRMGGQQIGGTVEAGGTVAVPLKNDPGVRELIESAVGGAFANPTASGAGGNPSGFAFVTTGTKASGTITIATNPTASHTVTINGVLITFVASGATGNQVNIGAAASNTGDNLRAFLSAQTTNTSLNVATYGGTGASVTVKYNTTGTTGNSFTLVSGQASVTVSGATLTGGVNGSDSVTRSSGSFLVDGFRAGAQVLVSGATTSGNNIVASDLVTIDSVTATVITLSTRADFTTAENFATGTTLTSRDYFAIAGSTRKFFTHEVAYLDLSPVVYEYFRGNEVNTANINVPTSGEVTAEFGMIGIVGKVTETQYDRSNNQSGTTVTGSGTYATTSAVSFAGSVNGSAMLRGGTSAVDVESFSISINNNRASKFAVGQQSAAFVEQGDFDAEMQCNLYFTDKSEIEDYLNGTRTSIEVTMVDQSVGDKLIMEFPTVVFTQNQKALSGQTVTMNCTAYAEENATYATKLRVWFQPAVSAT